MAMAWPRPVAYPWAGGIECAAGIVNPEAGKEPRRLGRADGKLVRKCKILDLSFQALPGEITASHSSLGGEFGEWIDVVKDASCARAGEAGAVHP